MSASLEIFENLGIAEINILAIAKGPQRNAGSEKLNSPGKSPIILQSHDPVLYFLQRLRDEAHRFAITMHRARRKKSIERSPLDEIKGIGGKRKRALLHHFGSAREVAQAGLLDLEAVEGINKSIAERIYSWFHPDGY